MSKERQIDRDKVFLCIGSLPEPYKLVTWPDPAFLDELQPGAFVQQGAT
jgi:hypothetical protein